MRKMLTVDYGRDCATVAVTGEITGDLAVELVDCLKNLLHMPTARPVPGRRRLSAECRTDRLTGTGTVRLR